MIDKSHPKINSEHLGRNAYLYIRQSTIKQVIENRESTKRQYNLKQRAIVLGWSENQINVIDTDLGESGASTSRDGFKRLVTEVSLGKAGIVMGLEVSRLARNSADWHRLLEICALSRTLILDEEGIYDPAHFNDRLLLGLKGTMSEAELHIIRSRLIGGMLNKAKRGELIIRLPVGFVYDPYKRIVLDPNKRVQESIKILFRTFRRQGTAGSTVKEFYKQGWNFPKMMYSGPKKGEIVFSKLTYSRVLQILKNPRYAGVYVYGVRQQQLRGLDKPPLVKYVEPDNWKSFIKNAHEGYITWEDYEENLHRLQDNSYCTKENRKCAPGEGPALLQGLAVCGVCGKRMTVRYHRRKGKKLSPDYFCPASKRRFLNDYCQSISGQQIDKLIGKILVSKMTPHALELAISIQEKIQTRIEEADRLRYMKVEEARYERELSQRRYMSVDPDNRLVADELEAIWNQKIKEYNSAKEEYEKKRQQDRLILSEQIKSKIRELTIDFPAIWENKTTSDRDRKRMVRLIIEDVTLKKEDKIMLFIRFKGGMCKTYELPLPQSAWMERKLNKEIVDEIDQLLDEHTDGEVAKILDQKGYLSGTGKRFDGRRVGRIRNAYDLKSYYSRLGETEKGLMSTEEICKKYGIARSTVYLWRDRGKLKGYRIDESGRYLYNPILNNV